MFLEGPVTASSTQHTQPPWEFLLTASRNTLQSYELSRLSHAANLRKEITSLLDQWLAENAAAMLARWLMEQRERSVLAHDATPLADASGNGAQSASDLCPGTEIRRAEGSGSGQDRWPAGGCRDENGIGVDTPPRVLGGCKNHAKSASQNPREKQSADEVSASSARNVGRDETIRQKINSLFTLLTSQGYVLPPVYKL
jgi:hypothetical protein